MDIKSLESVDGGTTCVKAARALVSAMQSIWPPTRGLGIANAKIFFIGDCRSGEKFMACSIIYAADISEQSAAMSWTKLSPTTPKKKKKE